MLRRRRSGAPVRRGTYQRTPWAEGPQSAWRPDWQSQAGWRPRWPQCRLRRGRFYPIGWPQGPRLVDHPTYISTRRPVPVLRRGHYYDVPVAVLDLNPPQYLDRRRLHIGPSRRGVFLDPPWPQADQGDPWPTFKVTRRTPPRPTRRGQYIEPPWPAPDPGRPTYLSTRRAPARPTRRGVYLDPTWAEGPRTVWRPGTRVSRRTRQVPPWRSGQYAPVFAATVPASATPAARTYTVPIESRTYTVPAESRTTTVTEESRTLGA